jgi:hypothetical protein
MTDLPNVFPGGGGPGTRIGIVVDHDGDPDQAGRVKVWIPGKYGPGVKREHLAYCSVQIPPTGSDQTISGTTPKRGSAVYLQGETGSPNHIITGLVGSEIPNFSGSMPGNINLLSLLGPIWEDVFKTDGKNPRNKRATFKETTENGALIRKLVNTGLFSHFLDNGIPSNGALAPVAGLKLPSIKNIPTAKQKYSNVLTKNMIDNLPGQFMSLGGLLSAIQSSKSSKTAATSNMPGNVLAAFNTLSDIAMITEINDGGNSITGNRVNPDIWKENAIILLNQVQTISDLVTVLNLLEYDTTLHGLGNYNLILSLDKGEGDFEIFETVFLQEDEKTYGTVKEWNRNEHILEITGVSGNWKTSANIIGDKSETAYNIVDIKEFLDSDDLYEIESQTPFGNTTILIDAAGNLIEKKSNTVYQTQNTYINSLASSSTYPSYSGGNVYGGSSGTMLDMASRLHSSGFDFSKKMWDQLNISDIAKSIFKKVKETKKGNPLKKVD